MYCELKGAKTVDTIHDAPSVQSVLDALQKALQIHRNLDVVTLTANGEPTLYPDLKLLIEAMHALVNRPKLLILSNGSTIGDLLVQEALYPLDIVKLSLDCATPQC
ncbi:MAG: radical SAM protein, partial [Sulfurospirillum cavolei]|nr:radical SAM protein [Sulfurospirillum cavolei]